MMKRRGAQAATLLLLLLLALGGCAGAHKTTMGADGAPLPTACFAMRARLEGIEHTAGMNSPQPATLTGRVPAERVSQATREAVDVTRQTASRLARIQGPAASQRALRSAIHDYRRLARHLRGASAANGTAGLRMWASFLRIAGPEISGCLPHP